ncbi:MAG TPA: hypothetical protein VM870_10195 [Pyrinomonadaceae bacterium]|nr:hypothetical protein [Pyrinomonadaceae bacterium]
MSRRLIERNHRRWAGLLLIATGVVLVLVNFLLAESGDATPAVRGSGLLLIAGVVAIIIGALLALTGKRIIPQ